MDLVLDAHTPLNSEDDPLFEITLLSLEQPLPNVCLPFDNADVVPANVSSTLPSSTTPLAVPVPSVSVPAVPVPAVSVPALQRRVHRLPLY